MALANNYPIRVELILINAYMPYEDDDVKSDEFVHNLSLIEEIIGQHGDCHVIIGGDFNVDFNRCCNHTRILSSFCDSNELLPTTCHSLSAVDYTYHFNMKRFSILDHFILSSTVYNTCVNKVGVLHCVENTSDHDPIFVEIKLDVNFMGFSSRVYAPRLSWTRACANDLSKYRSTLSDNLKCIITPFYLLLCRDLNCTDICHHNAITQYADAI